MNRSISVIQVRDDDGLLRIVATRIVRSYLTEDKKEMVTTLADRWDAGYEEKNGIKDVSLTFNQRGEMCDMRGKPENFRT
jgi:hypothetical protein